MDHIDDERIRFYLRHRELIETWAEVRKDVREAAHNFYMSLADDLGERAAEFGDDVVVWSNEGSWSKVGLYQPGWTKDGEPVVQACLEWHRKATFSDGTRYIGVRVNHGSSDGKALRPYLGDAIRDIRDAAGFGRRSGHWPAYQPAPSPDGEFWDDLSDHREQLVDLIDAAWQAFAEPVNQAVERWRAAGP